MKPQPPGISFEKKAKCLTAFAAAFLLPVLYGYGQPTISSFSPGSGPVGTSVTITGTNFSATAANDHVYFGVAKATVTAASTTSLTVTAPGGATYQPISVTVSTLQAWSAKPFILTNGSGYPFGNGSFMPLSNFTTSGAPYGVAIGDLDGDGKPDVAVADVGADQVSIFLNTSTSGTISFATRVDISLGTDAPNNVIIVDLDGDGKPDLATANGNTGNVSILRNTSTVGNVSFDANVDFTTASGTRWVTMGDIDGDGKPDLMAVSNGGTLHLLRNTTTSGVAFSSGSFDAAVDFATDANPQMAAFGDLDADGKPDIAVTSYTGSMVSLYRNTSTKGVAFSSGTVAAKVDLATGNNATGVAIGDLDGDGKPDLVVANRTSANISLYRNIITAPGAFSTGSFDPQVNLAGGNQAWRVAIADLDMDGKPDLAVVNAGTTTVSVYRNTTTTGAAFTTSSFDAQSIYTTGSGPQDIAIADLDGDHLPDLVAGDNGSTAISTLRNTGITTLPLQLLSFAGSLSGSPTGGQQVQLRWQTANEVNTAWFYVESSPDGVLFTQLGAVAAADNNASVSNYQYTDPHPRTGNNFYRLRMADIDGSATYSPIVEVSLTGSQSTLGVYPNPAATAGSVFVSLPSSGHAALLTLVSILGETVQQLQLAQGATQVQVGLKGVAPGVYTLVWTDGSNRQTQTLVVK